MRVSSDSIYGYKVNEHTSTEHDPNMVFTKRRFDLLGRGSSPTPDVSSAAHIDSVVIITTEGDSERELHLTDTDETPNLNVSVSDAGDVTITNPGHAGYAELSLTRVLPHQLAIDEARRKIAAAGPQIRSVTVENGVTNHEPWGNIDLA